MFSREFINSLTQDINTYITQEVPSQKDTVLGLAGYSNKTSNRVLCDTIIRSIENNKETNNPDEWINIVIALGETAHKIQSAALAINKTPLSADMLHHTRHRMLTEIRRLKDFNYMPLADQKTESKTLSDALAARIDKEKKALVQLNKDYLQARRNKQSEFVAEIVRKRRELWKTLAYLGELTPLMEQEPFVTYALFPEKTSARFPLFEYAAPNSTSTYGVSGISPTMPLVLQDKFCEIFTNKYKNKDKEPAPSPVNESHQDSDSPSPPSFFSSVFGKIAGFLASQSESSESKEAEDLALYDPDPSPKEQEFGGSEPTSPLSEDSTQKIGAGLSMQLQTGTSTPAKKPEENKGENTQPQAGQTPPMQELEPETERQSRSPSPSSLP